MAINIFVMPSSSIVLLLSAVELFGLSNALPWTGPKPTNVYRADAWSPAPTFVPVDPVELFKRSSVDVNICGWIGGNSANAATCSSGSSCIRDTIHGYVGCCTTSGACTAGVYTSCVDSNSVGWSPNSGLQNNGIYTCAGTSLCYRNTYPGGYYQYGCGTSNDAAQVATTYAGQASDALLQVVYTGVNFNPTSEVKSSSTASSSLGITTSSSAITSSSLLTSSTFSSTTKSSSSASTSQSIAVAGKASSTSVAQGTASASPTPAPAKKVSKGVIAGATVAGAAVLVGILGSLFWFCCRRRQNNRPLRAGSFITQHQNGQSPVSGPFQRITPFSPEDFASPLRGNPTHPPPEQDITGAYTYGGPEMSQPSNAANRWGRHYNFSQPSESAPLVSEIEQFSNGYHNAIVGHNNAHKHTTPDMVKGLGMGASMGIGAPLMRGGSSNSNHRTQNRDLTAEAFRSSQRVRAQSQSYNPADEGWTPQGLRGASGELSIRGGGASSSEVSYVSGGSNHGSRGGSRDGSDVSENNVGDESPEIAIPPRSPLRLNRMGNISAISAPARSPIDDGRPRYQLVDEVIERDDVPILKSPGRLRQSRIGRRGRG